MVSAVLERTQASLEEGFAKLPVPRPRWTGGLDTPVVADDQSGSYRPAFRTR